MESLALCNLFALSLLNSTPLCLIGKIMMRSHLECSTTAGKVQKNFTTQSHWHCCLCPQLFERNSEFVAHLKKHENSSVASSKKTCKVLKGSLNKSVQDTCTVSEKKVVQVCPQCLKVYANSDSLQRHIREVHKKKREGAVTASKYLNGVCRYQERNIYGAAQFQWRFAPSTLPAQHSWST